MTGVDHRLEDVRAEMRRVRGRHERSRVRSHTLSPAVLSVRHRPSALALIDRLRDSVPVLSRRVIWLGKARATIVDLLANEPRVADRLPTPRTSGQPGLPR